MVKDKLFLLSKDEVEKYISNKMNRRCMNNDDLCKWWLRSQSSIYGNTDQTGYVTCKGTLSLSGEYVALIWITVRPALHINPAYLQTIKRTKKGYIKFGGRYWLVLNEKTGLLLSKKAVCFHRFDAKSNDYEQSEIRTYMNDELLNSLFTPKEMEMIEDTVIDGESSYPVSS